jgi:hypothetical protein
MAKTTERLSQIAVERAKPRPGKATALHDGRGLYLRISPTGAKSWLFRYQINGRVQWMGLGGYPDVGLGRARQKLAEARGQKAEGIDPLATKKAARDAAMAAKAAAITFREAAGKYIKAHEAGWKNPKSTDQWTASLTTYAYPVIGKLSVGAIDTGHVTRILEPIWSSKTETAGRVRGRIEAILDYAKVLGWRSGENPARWKGHLDEVLPARGKVRKINHHPALPWGEIGGFMVELAQQEGVGALALRFAILTAARTGEVLGARWEEIDLKRALWIIPPERMKAGR